MKKIFIAIMAVAAAVSCSTELTVDAPKGAAIAFDNAFVENATRAADIDAEGIKAVGFGVTGYIVNTAGDQGKIFNNQQVAWNGSAYTYSPAQYWTAGNTYTFAALVPYTGAQWTYAATDAFNGEISFNNAAAAANQDLLYSYHSETMPESIVSTPAAVEFTFNHILSRVKFSFKNGFGEGENITLKVKDVVVTNVHSNGTVAVENGAVKDWTVGESTFNRAFGNAGENILAVGAKGTTEHFYFIPAAATYNLTFVVELYQANVLADTYNRTANVTLSLEKGKSYELTATLNNLNTSDDGELYPIEFNVDEVDEWENGEATVNTSAVVSTAEELVAAIANGGAIALAQDVTIAEGLQVTKSVNFDLNGHTLAYTGNDVVFRVKNGATVTIDGSKANSAIVTNPTNHGGASAGNGYIGLVSEDATLNINGGSYDAQRTCTIAQVVKGTLNVNAGTFKVDLSEYTDANGNASYLLNCTDANYKNGTAVVNVNGGSFYKFNPANNAAEGANTNFVALGYASVSNGEWYEVKQAPIVVKNGEVDYNGATLTVGAAPANTASTYGILCPEGTVTVKNLTIDGGDYRTTNDKGLRGIYITKAGNYTFENVVVKNVLYAINVNSTKSVVLNVVNSTLEGWTSYGNTTDATFTNVNFTCGKYANFKPYTNTTLTGCAFEGGFTIDLTEVAEGEVITFVNCTYGGVALTAENFNAVAKVDGYAAEKVAF